MDKKRVAVIPGDGIGKETVPEGLRVLWYRFRLEAEAVKSVCAPPAYAISLPLTKLARDDQYYLSKPPHKYPMLYSWPINPSFLKKLSSPSNRLVR